LLYGATILPVDRMPLSSDGLTRATGTFNGSALPRQPIRSRKRDYCKMNPYW